MCGGTRYRPEVLDAKVDGYSIADILDLTVDEAIEKFEGHTNITRPLQALSNTGLNYMTLGQSLDTLSGGETQRVKLSRYLTEDVTEKYLSLMNLQQDFMKTICLFSLNALII